MALFFAKPSCSTIKRKLKKVEHHISGLHNEIFVAVAGIYKDTKEVHGINGLDLIILVEDETKIKGRVVWESKWDTLIGFYGPFDNDVCVFGFKPVVGSGQSGYKNIVDAFQLVEHRWGVCTSEQDETSS